MGTVEVENDNLRLSILLNIGLDLPLPLVDVGLAGDEPWFAEFESKRLSGFVENIIERVSILIVKLRVSALRVDNHPVLELLDVSEWILDIHRSIVVVLHDVLALHHDVGLNQLISIDLFGLLY